MVRVQQNGPRNPYEVYCYRCNVTAPVGTRFCLHCSERLVGQKDLPASAQPISLDEGELVDSAAQRVKAASPMTIVWILLLVVGTLYRLCNG